MADAMTAKAVSRQMLYRQALEALYAEGYVEIEELTSGARVAITAELGDSPHLDRSVWLEQRPDRSRFIVLMWHLPPTIVQAR